jgi:MarR-like DNA-binding transcriptional regulator SgrR of sgrS sRNA
LFGCKSTEAPVTIIEGDPKAASADTTLQADDEETSGFMQLTIGELHPIKSMDPLFATNTSTKRFVQQLYEGLVRYNREGEVVSGIASDWTVSQDSLRYRFTLRSNVYYHDNNIFAAGTGQRVISDDFRYTFKRMARHSVPSRGAQLFMTIEGFEPFYREQHQLFNPDDRRLDDIEGIETPNDTTLIFQLREQDPHFLQKLASPYAVGYPKEAVRQTEDDQRITVPVGSGPFQFSQRQNDSTYILARFDGYWQNRNLNTTTPRLDRVDFMHRSEQTLLEDFQNGSIDLLPELGPYAAKQMVDTSGQLIAKAGENLELYRGGTFSYRLLYNKHSNIDRGSIHREIDALDFHQISSSVHPYVMDLSYKRSFALPDNSTQLTDPLQIPYSDDPYIKQTVREMKNAFEQRPVELQMNKLRVPVKSTGIIADQQVSLYPQSGDSLDEMTLVKFNVRHLGLSKTGLDHFTLNSYSWWIDLREAVISESNTSI